MARGRRRPHLLATALAASLGLSAPAGAALVVFDDGRHLHVAAFELVDDGERIVLTLDAGARMTIPFERVDRIVDDELDRTPPAAAGAEPLGAVGPPAPRPSVRVADAALPGETPFRAQILEAARRHRIDPAFVAAVVKAESNFAPRAVSRKGARGLMQLMPATARRLGVKRVFDPRENLQGGAAYLSELAERYGAEEVDLILAAYNAGEGAVAEHGGVPPFRETRAYVARVKSVWKPPVYCAECSARRGASSS